MALFKRIIAKINRECIVKADEDAKTVNDALEDVLPDSKTDDESKKAASIQEDENEATGS